MNNPTKIGRYEIIDRVGRGGMGVLYRARDTVLDREVAIKVMSTDFDTDADESARPRFYREARAAAKLQHRNIVTVFEFGEEENTPFIVMEFLRGQDLSKRMRSEPPLTLEAKLDIVADLCTGLHFAHEQGVVHRDVKPANIWIQNDGSIKLLDFGIAKFASSTMTRQGAMLGSVSYMSPEQVTGGEVDGRADVFAAGVVLYELLTGRKPFEGDSPTAVLARIMDGQPAPLDRLGPEIPRPLVSAVCRALEKDRDKRYRHAADFGADLRLVRSALGAAEPMTIDIELTRGITPTSLAGPTLVVQPRPAPDLAGGVRLAGPAGSAGETAAPVSPLRAWLVPAIAGAAVLVAAIAYFASRGTPAPTPENRPPAVAEASPGQAAPPDMRQPAGSPAGAAEAPREEPAPRRAAPRVEPSAEQPSAPAPASSEVVLTGSYPFEVYAGGRLESAASSEHRVRISGRQTLRLRAGEYFLDAPVVVDAGTRHVQAPELGRLELRIVETCSATLDGRNLGEPPYAEIPIAAGAHRVHMTCPDGASRDVPVTVRAGELRKQYIAK